MRNVLWFAAFLALPTSSAFARDSLWLICTGNGHRDDPATLELKEGTKTMFLGQIRVSLAASGSTLSLNGKMRRAYDASQELVPFEANLVCKDMSKFGDD